MQPSYRKFKDGRPTFKVQEEDPDIVHSFIELTNKMPSVYQVTGTFIYDEWIKFFETNYKDNHLITWKMEIDDYRQVLMQVRVDSGNGPHVVFIRSGRTRYTTPDVFDLSDEQKKYTDPRGILSFDDFDILYDPEMGLPGDFVKSILKAKVVSNEEVNKIHLICQDQDIGLYTKEFPIQGDQYNFDLDLHYGSGMEEFHTKQIKRLVAGSKGIILLYGDPGTGKSFYIKRLCKDLFKVDKKILYLPNNMVDNIGTPSFNNFLLDWADDNIEEGTKKGILIIIEDAERVLLKREDNPYGADGVSNILNSTDGILNDFLNIQVLATFNTTIDKIDDAILRKKRALAIKEFKKLSVEDSQKLIDHMGVDIKATEAMSLADIFAITEEDEDAVLFNDTKKEQSKIGFRNK